MLIYESQSNNYFLFPPTFRLDPQKADGKIGPFPDMDSPEKTFELIQEFSDYSVNNGFLPYSTIQDATQNIKKQLSHIFGNLLREKFDPLKAQIQDVLSEIKTLRHELLKETKNTTDYYPYLTAIRFIIDESNSLLKDLLSGLFRTFDEAIPIILTNDTFDNFIKSIGWTLKISTREDIMNRTAKGNIDYDEAQTSMIHDYPQDMNRFGNQRISWAIKSDKKTIFLNELTKEYFEWKYTILQDDIKNK